MTTTAAKPQLESKTIPEEIVACTICASDAAYAGTRREYKFYRCESCRHLFVWPVPGGTLQIYTTDYFSGASQGFGYVDYDRDKQPMAFTFDRYLDILRRLSPNGKVLLDVGAATGFFLDLARKRDWRVFGVEPSDYAASIGREKGIQIETGVLGESHFPPNSFDVVTLWDVIEHLPEPRTALASIHAVLKPGGILAINTPDSGSLLAKTLGLKWHLVVPPEHINLFHRKSLSELLQSSGFEVLSVSSIGKRFTLQYVFQTLAHWSGNGLFQRLSSRLQSFSIGRLGVPINLFDNMVLCARKRT
jgi:SAM-dependent methyltransferase